MESKMLRRIQKMICAMLLAVLLVSAATPALAKSVTAKVNSSSAKVYQKASKSSRSVSVRKGTTLTVTAVSGDWARVSKNGHTGYMQKKYLSANVSWKSRVVKKNWFSGGSSVLKKGSYGYIYDIDTGITVKIKRMGGHYHADVEPATASDTAKLLRIAGGKFSWKSHAVILSAGGKFVACAINTLPHGDQTIRNNNYNGQFCLHMSGSWTHASSKENSDHQRSINRAYKWARG